MFCCVMLCRVVLHCIALCSVHIGFAYSYCQVDFKQ